MAEESSFSFGAPSPASVPADHPLRHLFRALVMRAFQEMPGPAGQHIWTYLADMLTDFAHTDNLYRLRSGAGVRLEQVTEMLLEGDVLSNATSFERERAVHKHIGDFTLFWAGVYPEMLERLRAANRADSLLDYVRQGKQSYYIVSTFQHGPHARDAGLFRQLSDEFEWYQQGLRRVRREWESLASAPHRP